MKATIIDTSGVKVSENMTVLGPVVLKAPPLPDVRTPAQRAYAEVMAAGEGGKWNVETNEVEGLTVMYTMYSPYNNDTVDLCP